MLEITEITLTQLRFSYRGINSENPQQSETFIRTDLNAQNWPAVGEFLNLFPNLPVTLTTLHIHLNQQFADELFLITYANFIRQMQQLTDIGLIISDGWEMPEYFSDKETRSIQLTEVLAQISQQPYLKKFWFYYPRSSWELHEKAHQFLNLIARRVDNFFILQEFSGNLPLAINGLKDNNNLEQLCCPDFPELEKVILANRLLRAIRISGVCHLTTLQAILLIANQSNHCTSIEISLSPIFLDYLPEQWLILTDLFKSNITQLKIINDWRPFIDDQLVEGVTPITVVEKMTSDITKLLMGRTNLKLLSIPIIWNETDNVERQDYFAKRIFNTFRSNLCRVEALDLTYSSPSHFINPVTFEEFFKVLTTNTYLRSIRLGHLWTQTPPKRAFRDVYYQTLWDHSRATLLEKIETYLQQNYTIIEIDFLAQLLDSKSQIPNILKRNLIIRNELISLIKMGFDNHQVRTLPHRFASRFRGSLNLSHFHNQKVIQEIFYCFRLQIQHDSTPTIRMTIPSPLPVPVNSFISAAHRKIYEILTGNSK